MCRTTYLEKDELLHSDSDEEEDDDETLYDSDEDEDATVYSMNNTTDRTIIATPTNISDQLQKRGYTITDIVSLWTNRIDRQNKRYTQSFVKTMIKDIDSIIHEADEDKYNILVEREMMEGEDARAMERDDGYIFDSFRLLFNTA
jgi:cupin superfamily acireductone dioxygenase involved in methionine salvage